MPNVNLPPPPNNIKISNEGSLTTRWRQWFNDVFTKISTSNHQTATAAGALDLDAQYVSLKTTGSAFAVTLGAPNLPGVYKVIEMTADGGYDVTMSLSNCVGGSAATTCTWNDVNDTLTLVSISDKWLILDEHGVALT